MNVIDYNPWGRMSGCETPIVVDVKFVYDPTWSVLRGHCDCDHGEDDPCCAEPTEPPTDDEAA